MVNAKAASLSICLFKALSRALINNRRLQNIAACLSIRNIEYRIRLNNICEGKICAHKTSCLQQ